MKKQIKKLVKKTYLFDDYETVADRQQKIYSFTEEGLEKFAELIVAECVEQLITGVKCNPPQAEPPELVKTLVRRIRRHFGVAE